LPLNYVVAKRACAGACRRQEASCPYPRWTVSRSKGHVKGGFEAVREAFAENFARRGELGGACCVYHHGDNVVDLRGGVRNKHTGEPWEQDTMVIVHSSSKGLAAMTLAIAHSRGWLDYEERVAHYWPEFAQHGKGKITVRQLLAHQVGLFAFDEPVDRSVVADLDRLGRCTRAPEAGVGARDSTGLEVLRSGRSMLRGSRRMSWSSRSPKRSVSTTQRPEAAPRDRRAALQRPQFVHGANMAPSLRRPAVGESLVDYCSCGGCGVKMATRAACSD
jgi:CubicO group peptidase (beta-lactamase class C family)